MNPILTETRTVTDSGNIIVNKNRLPMPDWRNFWPRIVGFVAFTPDPDALRETVAGIRAEQKILAAFSHFASQNVSREFERRQKAHVEAIDTDALSPETTFAHSLKAIELEFRGSIEALQKVLEARIARNRPHAKKLLESILEPIAATREKIEKKEATEAEEFGTPFKPTDKLLILACAEHDIRKVIDGFDKQPLGNSTRALIRDSVPPGLVD